MIDVFSNKAKKILFIAQEEAAFLKKTYVGPEHILLAIIREADPSLKVVLSKVGLRYNVLRKEIEILTKDDDIRVAIKRDLTPNAKLILRNAVEESILSENQPVDLPHVLKAILKLDDSTINRLLSRLNISKEHLIKQLDNIINNKKNVGSKSNNKYPMIQRCTINLTQLAKSNKLDPVIGRKREINRLIRILARRLKNNPVLLGEPGVGKSAIVEGLAQMIVSYDVPSSLEKKEILQLSLASLIAGAKFRGDFEDRIKKLIDEIKQHKNVILFIDELHTIVGAGAPEGSMDAANILKPALARGEIQVIGATTIEEYRKYVEKDTALERRFQPIYVEEASLEETIKILEGIAPNFERYHMLNIEREAIIKAAEWADRHINGRFLPDKAIDLLDEAAAKVKIENIAEPIELRKYKCELEELKKEEEEATKNRDYEIAALKQFRCMELEQKIMILEKSYRDRISKIPVLTADDVADVLADWTGIPVKNITRDEGELLLNLESELSKFIIGQDEAISLIASAIRRSRLNLRDPLRPMGAFLFLGPSGVGKTETAKVIANSIFKGKNSLIRIDMSEYMEKHAVSRLLGAPPGYIGFDKGGILIEAVRRNPYSVVLFDEIEKAHPDVFNILLQILDEGHLTSSQGKKVSFKNCIIILTSNLGTGEIIKRRSIGYADSGEDDFNKKKNELISFAKKKLSPELVDRLDEIVVFNALKRKELEDITYLQLERLKHRLIKEKKINIEITENLIQNIVNMIEKENSGARPIRRIIEKHICDFIAKKILNMDLGDKINISFDDLEMVAYKSEDKSYTY